MARKTQRNPLPQELAHRSNDGLDVVLLWHAEEHRLTDGRLLRFPPARS